MHHAAIAGCDAGPLMHGTFEHFGAADEIADMPIGQRDLGGERRGVEQPARRACAGTVPLTTLAAACNIICLRNVQAVLKRSNVRARFTPLSSPGLTGRSSIPETSMGYREAAAYWIPRLRGE